MDFQKTFDSIHREGNLQDEAMSTSSQSGKTYNCGIPQLRYIPYLQDIHIPQLRDNVLLELQSP